MRKAILTLVALLAILGAKADIGEFALGAQSTYGTRDKAMSAGVNMKYNFTYHWRLNLLADYHFKKNDVWGMELAMEGNYLIYLGDKVRLYPLIGYGVRTYHETYDLYGDKETDTDSRMFVHGGLGAEYLIGEHLMLNAAAKCQYNGEFNQGLFSIGAAWRF